MAFENVGREELPPLDVYEYENQEDGITYTSPFPAAVFGIHKEFFGVGRVLGLHNDNPVIEILDRDDGQPYYVMGYESWWTCPIPDEVVDNMANGRLKIDSVAAYRQSQDDYWKTVEMGDDTFLDENGIDPES